MIWGNKWASLFPTKEYMDAAIIEWGTALYGVSGEWIAAAIDKCKLTMDWPPSIAEFVALCKPPLEARNFPEYNSELLTYQPSSTPESFAEAEKAREKIRNVLGLKRM